MSKTKRKTLKEGYNLKPGDFNTGRKPTWCLGCGNYGIWNSLKKTFVKLILMHHEILIVYGIGCSGNCANFIKTYAFHALHGRTLPVATGAKLANHKLNVVIMGGDGDGVGIGGNHFIHTCRRNLNLTYLLHNNKVYGLTTGQTAPTSDRGFKTKSTPSGVLEKPINPVLLALVCGATYVARGFSGDTKHLSEIMKKAIKRSMEEEKIPVGIFYQVTRPVYEDELKQIERKPLVDHIISDVDINRLPNDYY